MMIKFSKVKNKERILTAAGEKQLVMYNGVPITISADFSAKYFIPGDSELYCQSSKRKENANQE